MASALHAEEPIHEHLHGILVQEQAKNLTPRERQALLSWASAVQPPLSRTKPERRDAAKEPSEPKQRVRHTRGRASIAAQRIDRELQKRRVDTQKIFIIRAMKREQWHLVERATEELTESQQQAGGATFLVKSLCDLAKEAKLLGLLELQLNFAQRAIDEAPADPWAWSQYADALLQQERLDDALEAYEEAVRLHPNDVVPKTGRAEVLKAMGRLDEALDAYNEVTHLHPNDVVPKNGRAEVLKAMGRLDEALDAYNEVAHLHPEDVFAKTGRAEVLKAMGSLDEALDAYNEVAHLHPNDVVPKTGRAEVLKAMGRLDEALDAYNEVTHLHPNDVVPKNGRAEVLKTMGRLDEALDAYNEVAHLHPEDVFAKNGRAEVLKAMGRLDEALDAYNEVAHLHPNEVVPKNGRAEVLKAMGRLDEALDAYNEAAHLHSNEVVPKTGRAEVLKAMGRLDEALDAYNEVAHLHPNEVVPKTGRAEVLKAMGRLDEALDAYDEVMRRHPKDMFARSGRAGLLALMGRYEEILTPVAKAPATEHDWVYQHIQGMAFLRSGRFAQALRMLRDGATRCPFPAQRDYFNTALSLACLQSGSYAEARKALDRVSTPTLSLPVRLLRAHALGLEGDRHAAALEFDEARRLRTFQPTALTDEIQLRFVRGEAGTHSDMWVLEQEVDLVLRAA